jgi:hypothetical protein
MSEDNSEAGYSPAQRRDAYKNAVEAYRQLEYIAYALGYDSMTDMMEAGHEGNIPEQHVHAVRAITNAYSYLDDGAVWDLNPSDEERD